MFSGKNIQHCDLVVFRRIGGNAKGSGQLLLAVSQARNTLTDWWGNRVWDIAQEFVLKSTHRINFLFSNN